MSAAAQSARDWRVDDQRIIGADKALEAAIGAVGLVVVALGQAGDMKRARAVEQARIALISTRRTKVTDEHFARIDASIFGWAG